MEKLQITQMVSAHHKSREREKNDSSRSLRLQNSL